MYFSVHRYRVLSQKIENTDHRMVFLLQNLNLSVKIKHMKSDKTCHCVW